jgi:hypothetical protein
VGTDIYTYSGYTYYYADVYDYTNSEGCDGTSSAYYMGEAYYAEFMGEDDMAHDGALINFTTVSFSDSQYVNWVGSDVYIGNSWTNAYIIDQTTYSHTCDGNSVEYNVCPSGVSSGSFSLTYLDGRGT